MNGFVGGTIMTSPTGPYHYSNYRAYIKDSDFTVPGSSKLWLFVDEHPDSINDGLFAVDMTMPPFSYPTYVKWEDVPASYHNGACGFGFCDGHAEIKKWLDSQSKAPILGAGRSGGAGVGGVAGVSPYNGYNTTSPHDSQWVVERTSAPN
jgi:prepilin-type processing-associated H-X9-DG protein